MKTAVRVCAIIAFFTAIIGCGSGGGTASIPLSNWQFRPELIGAEKPGDREDAWQPYVKPWPLNKNVLFFKINHEEAWVRADFKINKTAGSRYGAIISGTHREAPVYINSHPLEVPRNDKFTNVYSPVARPIPDGVLNDGVNTVFIKVRFRAGYSAITDNAQIMDNDGMTRATFINELIYNQLPLAILIFNISMLFPPLIYFFWNRREKVLAYSSLVLFTIIVYILLEFIPARYTGVIIPQAHLAAIPVFGVLLFISIQGLFRIYISVYSRVVIGVCLSAAALVMLIDRAVTEIYAPYVILAGIVILIPLSIFIFNMIGSIRRDRILYSAMIIFIIFTASLGVYELVSFITDFRFVFLTVIYSSPLFVITFIILTGRGFMKRMIKMEVLYSTIKKPERVEKDPTITDSSENKLNSVIDFINMNYTQDIAREGLAGAIDMSTDYMSRLFRKYTGKKISEYINELRIKDAIHRLEQGEEKIIDIALSVGFESLSTFNRAFKNVTGTTPTSFRNQR